MVAVAVKDAFVVAECVAVAVSLQKSLPVYAAVYIFVYLFTRLFTFCLRLASVCLHLFTFHFTKRNV